jgi:hypothetical protein
MAPAVTSRKLCDGVASQSSTVTPASTSNPSRSAQNARTVVTSTLWSTGGAARGAIRRMRAAGGAKCVEKPRNAIGSSSPSAAATSPARSASLAARKTSARGPHS